LTSTPRYRVESRRAEATARGALETVGLRDAAERVAAELTGAERRLLVIAAALATDPSVLLLDEPAAGAADDELENLARLLQRLKKAGRAILLVEHNPKLVAAAADVVVELDGGRVVRSGPL
jgi:branched-chain amino acid transport system ATP-binding protein